MIRLRTLANGLRIATENIEGVRSCGVGLFLDIGSRHEHEHEAGLSHFIEHMLFKGTRHHDARGLADAANFLGGNVNAYTTQESICLHAKTVDGKAHLALDLLCEMLLDSTFPEEEVARERQVILEEYKMVEDNPDELGVDQFVKNLWPGHPLGRPIIGTRQTIRRFSRAGLLQYWRREFNPSRLVVALAGACDEAACNEVITRRLEPLRPGRRTRRLRQPFTGTAPRTTYHARTIEQTHFCLGVQGPDRLAEDRYAYAMMNMILGGGMSSRLFQEIREKRGLAYSIGSFAQLFSDIGLFGVTGATSPEVLEEVLRISLTELALLATTAPPADELDLARAQVTDAMLMSLENTESRMTRLAESLITYGRVVSVDEVIAAVNAVTPEQVRDCAARYLQPRRYALSLIGPAENRSILKKIRALRG
jgi:predicted Zn-dependent peptidase